MYVYGRILSKFKTKMCYPVFTLAYSFFFAGSAADILLDLCVMHAMKRNHTVASTNNGAV